MKIRWQETISEFDIIIEYIKGKEKLIADILSRTRTYKNSITLSSSNLSPSPNHSTTLFRPVAVNYVFISYPHPLPLLTKIGQTTSLPQLIKNNEWNA